MKPGKTRLLLWSGFLGAVVLFAGDILYYGEWDSAWRSHNDRFSVIEEPPLKATVFLGESVAVRQGFDLLPRYGTRLEQRQDAGEVCRFPARAGIRRWRSMAPTPCCCVTSRKGSRTRSFGLSPGNRPSRKRSRWRKTWTTCFCAEA